MVFSDRKNFLVELIHSQESLSSSSGSRHFYFEFIDLSAIGSSSAEFHSSVFSMILRNSKIRINDANVSDTWIEFVLDGLFLIFNKGLGRCSIQLFYLSWKQAFGNVCLRQSIQSKITAP